MASRFAFGTSGGGAFGIVARSGIETVTDDAWGCTKFMVNVASEVSKRTVEPDVCAGLSGKWGCQTTSMGGLIVRHLETRGLKFAIKSVFRWKFRGFCFRIRSAKLSVLCQMRACCPISMRNGLRCVKLSPARSGRKVSVSGSVLPHLWAATA